MFETIKAIKEKLAKTHTMGKGSLRIVATSPEGSISISGFRGKLAGTGYVVSSTNEEQQKIAKRAVNAAKKKFPEEKKAFIFEIHEAAGLPRGKDRDFKKIARKSK